MARKKKNPAEQYAYWGLVVAGLATVSTVLIALARGLVALKLFPDQSLDSFNVAFNISWPLIIVGLAAYGFMAPDAIQRFVGGRQARFGVSALIRGLAFTGIVIVTNVLVFQNPSLLKSPWDMTEGQSNTLSKPTLQALATLPQKVQATAFFSGAMDRTTADALLKNFKTFSNGKFDYSFVNPDSDPVAARQAGITGDGKVLLQMGKHSEIASFASETEIAKALIRLINPQARVVYFLQGEGEAPLDSGDKNYSVAKQTLESKNYTVNPLNLLVTHQIPKDALAIIIAGPQKPVSADEITLLKKYVDGGGALVVLEDPVPFTEFADSPDPLADYLLSDWGIKLNNDLIIDLANSQNPFQAISSRKGDHPITQDLSQNYIVILPQARSIAVAGKIDGVTQTPLIMTADNSWGETDLSFIASKATPSADPQTDNIGPVNLAVAADNSKTKGRVVVFGNSLFATDRIFDAYGNGNIFINSVDWAAAQEDLINITPRTPIVRSMRPIPNIPFIIIILLSIVVLPGAVLLLGVLSWAARRRRG